MKCTQYLMAVLVSLAGGTAHADCDDTIEAARLFTAAAFADAGGYDQDLGYGGEDWDLSRRVADRFPERFLEWRQRL